MAPGFLFQAEMKRIDRFFGGLMGGETRPLMPAVPLGSLGLLEVPLGLREPIFGSITHVLFSSASRSSFRISPPYRCRNPSIFLSYHASWPNSSGPPSMPGGSELTQAAAETADIHCVGA
jgi:hypothetical protein